MYQNPPIQEVLCEFIFPDAITLEQIDAVLKELYDEFPIENRVKGKRVNVILEQPSNFTMEDMPDKFQVFNQSKDTLYQLNGKILSVNKLPPYTNFNDFLKTVEKVLRVYQSKVQPTQLERWGVQKLNRIKFNAQPIAIDQHFAWRMVFPHGFENADFTTYSMQAGLPQSPTATLNALLQPIPFSDTPNAIDFIFDLYYIETKIEPLNVDELLGNLQRASEMMTKWFNASLTEQTKQLFNPIST